MENLEGFDYYFDDFLLSPKREFDVSRSLLYKLGLEKMQT